MQSRPRHSRIRRQDLESSAAAGLAPGSTEIELGVPIPGVILPKEQWARTALKKLPESGMLDWAELFGRVAPIILDLGCGNGRFVVGSAIRRPAYNHLGIDILPVVIRYATRRANQRGLHHVRFAVVSAAEFLERHVPRGTVRELHVYHPQPYAGSQTSRRLLNDRFFFLACQALEAGGKLFLQSDHAGYWKELLVAGKERFSLKIQEAPWPDDELGRTRREILSRARGKPIFRAIGYPR